MRPVTMIAAGLALLAAAPAAAQAPAAPPATSPLVTTAILADLCKASGTTGDAAVAVGYCRGFLVATWQYHYDISRPGGRTPIFCLPDPAPTLDAARTGFVAWAETNPQYAGERGMNGLLRWAASAYPCPPQSTARRAASR